VAEHPQIYPTPSRAWLDVDTGALVRNAERLRAHAGRPVIPMVKANAYGVGVSGVVRALERIEPWGYGVATVKEGEELRALGVRRPVIVFTPLLPQDLAPAHAAGLTPSLASAESIHSWSAMGGAYHLAIDTGMSRAGIAWREIASLRDAVREHPPEGAYTHFHSAEGDDGSMEVQARRFRDAIDALGVRIPFVHADNSAAILRNGGRYDAIRPGVFLYGVGCDGAFDPEPVVALRARVVDLRWLEPGDTVSYGATYTARRRTRIATVAAGYGDGYPRALSDHGIAHIAGETIPLRGRVTMDMTMFDVTGVSCEIGDVVTLIDGVASDELSVASVAGVAQMSPYELLTGMAPRLERRFTEI
jgi:alanine racemase